MGIGASANSAGYGQWNRLFLGNDRVRTAIALITIAGPLRAVLMRNGSFVVAMSLFLKAGEKALQSRLAIL
jgi:hypothetical protein